MRRICLAVLAGLMLCLGTTLFAGLKEADDLYNQGKYDEALTEYQKVLPELKGADAGRAQYKIGDCLFYQKKYNEAIEAYKGVFSIQGAGLSTICSAQYCIGLVFESQKKYDEAISEFKKVMEMQGVSSSIGYAQYHIGICLEAQGKPDEAQQYYLVVCRQEGASLGLYKIAFSKIKKSKLTNEEYKDLLQTMVRNINADNSEAGEFIGKLMSELDKIKKLEEITK